MAKSKSFLGDARLGKPFTRLVEALVTKYTHVLRKLGNGRKEEVSFSRFIQNSKVTATGLIRQYWSEHSVKLSGKHVLIVTDGSDMCFTYRKDRTDLGYIGESNKVGGFEVHSSMLLDADTFGCYGLGSAQIRITPHPAEDSNRKERQRARQHLSFEEKDRYKWYTTPEAAANNCPGAAAYTVVGDMESAIYEVFSRFKKRGLGFVIRDTGDRLVYQKGEGDNLEEVTAPVRRTPGGKKTIGVLLSELLPTWEVAHSYSLEVSETKERSKHSALLHLKFGKVFLLRPQSSKNKHLPKQLEVQVIEIQEDPSTVVAGEKPIHWILITSHEVENVEKAMTVVSWYHARWNIEQVHRTLKTKGIDIESSEVQNQHALANLTVLCMIAAVKVMQLVMGREGQTQQTIDCAFTEQEVVCMEHLNPGLEGNTEKQKNPHPKMTLGFASWIIARLGGWDGYTHLKARPPGPITMIDGLIKFYLIAKGYQMRV